MKTYQLHTASGEEILVECDELLCDHSCGRILVVKGNEMKAYLASTIISYHELTTTLPSEALREQHHDPAILTQVAVSQ